MVQVAFQCSNFNGLQNSSLTVLFWAAAGKVVTFSRCAKSLQKRKRNTVNKYYSVVIKECAVWNGTCICRYSV